LGDLIGIALPMGLFAFYSVRGYGFDTVNNKAEVVKCMIARLDPFFFLNEAISYGHI